MKITTSDLMMLLSKSCFNSKGMTFVEVAKTLQTFMQERGLEIEDAEERGWLPIKVFEWCGNYADPDYHQALKLKEEAKRFDNYGVEKEKVARLIVVMGKTFTEVHTSVEIALTGKVFKELDPALSMALYFYEKYGNKDDLSYKFYLEQQPKDAERPFKVIPNYKEFLRWIAGRVCSEGCTVASLAEKINLEIKVSNIKYAGTLPIEILPEKAAIELLSIPNQYNMGIIQRAKTRKYHAEPDASLVTLPEGMKSGFGSAFRTKEQNEFIKPRVNPESWNDLMHDVGVAIDIATLNVFKSTKPKETIMSTKPVETITYIYGQDVNAMSEDQLIGAIKRMEAEIEEYKKVKAHSAKIDSRVKDLETAIETATAALDSK